MIVLIDAHPREQYIRTGTFIQVTRRTATEAELARGASLAKELRDARIAAHLSQEALARGAGLSVETIRKIEAGARPSPALFTISSIARTLNLSLDSLVARLDGLGATSEPPRDG